MKRAQKRAILMGLILAVLVLSVVFSTAVMAGHNCMGEGCPLCLQTNALREMLRALACVGLLFAGIAVMQSRAAILGAPAVFREGRATPVSLKIKLLN